MKSKRVTIVLDGKVDKKLRHLQAEEIKKRNGSYSFSKILNRVLEQGLKK